jgi:hypothetical protein
MWARIIIEQEGAHVSTSCGSVRVYLPVALRQVGVLERRRVFRVVRPRMVLLVVSVPVAVAGRLHRRL